MTARARRILEPARPAYAPTWIATADGSLVDLVAPDPAAVDLRTFAEQIAKLPRYNAATPGVAWSVGQHSLLVEALLPQTADGRLKLYGLLHDFHEALIGDIARPTLAALRHFGGETTTDAIGALAQTIDNAVYAAIGVCPPDSAHLKAVRAADDAALAIEWRDFMIAPPPPALAVAPAHPRLKPLPWPVVQEKLVERLTWHAELYGLAGPAIERLLPDLEIEESDL